MTALQEMGEQPLTVDSLVPITLKIADGWDQVTAFVTLTMRCKMEIMWERQRRPIATATQRPMPDLASTQPPPSRSPLTTQQQKRKKTIQTGLTRRHLLAVKIPTKLRILN